MGGDGVRGEGVWLYQRLRSADLRQADAFIVLPGFAGHETY